MWRKSSLLDGILTFCRIAVGVTIMYAGSELVRGDGLLTSSGFGDLWTGLFVMAIGVSCILSSLFSGYDKH